MMGRVYRDGPLVNSQKSTSRRIDDTYLRDTFYKGISLLAASRAHAH